MNTLTATQLKQKLDRGDDFTLINTLSEDNFASTKIPDAISIPHERDDFVSRVEQQLGSKDQSVVVYCASADCQSSSKAAARLEEAGFSDVADFEGGAKEWQAAGEQLVTVS